MDRLFDRCPGDDKSKLLQVQGKSVRSPSQHCPPMPIFSEVGSDKFNRAFLVNGGCPTSSVLLTPPGCLRAHRKLVQHPPAALDDRPSQTGPVRSTTPQRRWLSSMIGLKEPVLQTGSSLILSRSSEGLARLVR